MAVAKKPLFSGVYIIGATCFDELFLFYVITGRHCFSWKFVVTPKPLKCHVTAFFEASASKKSAFYVISTVTI